MKKVNKKKGFTLAELLVVIAILAILVAIAVPIFGGALDNAEKTARDSNSHALRSAGMVHILTNNTAKGTWGWEVKGSVDSKGNMSVTAVNAANSAVTDSQPASGVAGDYIVGLEPSDVTP